MKSSLPFTSVVSYHTNPMTCGVAKFSAELAKRLGVPFYGLMGREISSFPLFSLKASELDADARWMLFAMCNALKQRGESYGFFWHDAGVGLGQPAHVFYADPSLGSPGLWCPSLITPRERPVRLFSFGMAHKLQTDKYRRVRELLDAAGKRYHLRVSVGIHEGTSLDGAEKHFDALREIMGAENVTILGILSDDAVSEELSNADYVLAFFEKGVRGNNTTVHAALEHRRSVITNFDAQSPAFFDADIHHLDCWTKWPVYQEFGWVELIEAMRKECDRGVNAA